jgi:hypothetical protein
VWARICPDRRVWVMWGLERMVRRGAIVHNLTLEAIVPPLALALEVDLEGRRTLKHQDHRREQVACRYLSPQTRGCPLVAGRPVRTALVLLLIRAGEFNMMIWPTGISHLLRPSTSSNTLPIVLLLDLQRTPLHQHHKLKLPAQHQVRDKRLTSLLLLR